jgi:hypothetical protein
LYQVYLTELHYIPEEKSLKGLYIHLDNACPQNARRSTESLLVKNIQRISHPDYSPDLAPSDFFLFGCIKQKLTENNIPDRQSLKNAIAQIFDETKQETLRAVFETWINRLEWVMEHDGE